MNTEKLLPIFSAISNVRIGVIGDFAVDVYYNLNKDTGELSVETGKPVHYGSSITTHLGSASNVVNNLHAIGVRDVFVFGFIGDDIFGRELTYLLQQIGVHTDFLKTVMGAWDTCAYIKPMIGNEEDNRLDFGSTNVPTRENQDDVLNTLAAKINDLDVVIINQQFINPLINERGIEILNDLIAKNPQCKFFADLRQNGEKLRGVVLKVNAGEVARILGGSPFSEDDTDLCIKKAKQAQQLIHSPLLMTRGAHGMIYVDDEKTYTVPGIPLSGEIDSVGAGDTCISAFSSAAGSGAEIFDAMQIANMAAAVTVKKLRQTGTASPEEIEAINRKITGEQ